MNVRFCERNLTNLPNTTNDEPVSLLNLCFNVLKTLEEDALLNYKPVSYLCLQYCKLININGKMLRGLEKLIVKNISNNR
jgi:hypothetical protein